MERRPAAVAHSCGAGRTPFVAHGSRGKTKPMSNDSLRRDQTPTGAPADPANRAADAGPYGGQRATFAAGCFWGIETAFREIEGVLQTSVGYTGGHEDGPSYDQVCRGTTGHAEAVEIWFDPAQLTYGELLEVFWAIHDPTSRGHQGWDFGDQYRSAIFTHTPEQQLQAEASREAEQQSRARPITTEIVPASVFHRAEEYHQRYFEKNGGVLCLASSLR